MLMLESSIADLFKIRLESCLLLSFDYMRVLCYNKVIVISKEGMNTAG